MRPATVKARVNVLLDETRNSGYRDGYVEGVRVAGEPERHCYLAFVDGDGCEALYVDGHLAMQGERLDPVGIARLLVKRTLVRLDHIDADIATLEEMGGKFPKLLLDVPKALP